MNPRLLALTLALALLPAPLVAQAPQKAKQAAVDRIVEAALKDEQAYANLEWLCDRIGNRLAGSKGLEKAVAWSLERLKAEGFQNVHPEKVMVPHWERISERAELLEPLRRPLNILALGDSPATPAGGVEGEVLVVASLAELEKLPGDQVRGRIVLFEAPWKGYGEYSSVRYFGPTAAAKKGALAMLLGAFAPRTLDTPHTGVMQNDPMAPPVPAAGLSLEAATQMRRLCTAGAKVRVHLDIQARRLPDAESANVIGEFPGTGKPEEIVVVGGHLDSWDVGQGAQDDGVGCVLSMEAARIIHRLGLKPRRTIRVVLFTNEENGSRGGKAYLDAHKDELDRHVAAIESDIGNGLIQGFGIDVRGLKDKGEARQAQAAACLKALRPYLEPLGAGKLENGGSGVDIGPTVAAGVPGLGAEHDTARYWDIHHTQADTFDKVDKRDLRKNLAILASALYLIADLPERP
jgi:hypothetical protein